MRKINTEIIEAYRVLDQVKNPIVSIFGSARIPKTDPYYQATEKLALLLSNAGFSVVSGGGPGIMEAANKGAFAGQSESIGLNIALPMEQHSNFYQDISLEFHYFESRKFTFSNLSAAYIAMPGGFGTLDEIMSTLILLQTRKIAPRPFLFFDADFWQELIQWFEDKLLADKMIHPEDLHLFQIVNSPEEAVDILKATVPLTKPKTSLSTKKRLKPKK